LPLFSGGETFSAGPTDREANDVNILWIILVVILVLALLGFFSRGRW
jgi:flagellar basal body-associated protein FliL